MSKVFVVQRPAYFCRERRGWVNKYDIGPALEYGELVYLLKPGNIYRDKLASAIDAIRDGLEDYSTNDHILAIGDPVAISATVMIASSRTGGVVKMLKYDRIDGVYESYKINI